MFYVTHLHWDTLILYDVIHLHVHLLLFPVLSALVDFEIEAR